jgi:hypothetical protein
MNKMNEHRTLKRNDHPGTCTTQPSHEERKKKSETATKSFWWSVKFKMCLKPEVQKKAQSQKLSLRSPR